MSTVTIDETTVGDLGEVSVGCGNFCRDGSYALPDGSVRSGRTITLAPFDRDKPIIVGEGSELVVGGTRWRVTEVEKSGHLGTVTLLALDPGLVVDGIDFGPDADLAGLVARHLAGTLAGSVHPDDRTPLDWLKRTYRALADLDLEAARRFGRAIAVHLGAAGPTADGLILRFFSDLPTAEGGERVAEVAATALHRYPPDLPDPTPGNVTDRLRESLLRTALRYRAGAGLPSGVLVAAKDAIRSGDGPGLLYDVARLDPDWATAHLLDTVALYPDASSTYLRVLARLGMEPDDIVDRLLPHADARGRSGLADEIRHRYGGDLALRDRLLARLG